MQQPTLVEQTGIEIAVLADPFAGQEAEDTDTVVEVDDHHVPAGLLDDSGGVEVAVRVSGVAAALDEDPDRQTRARCGIGRLEYVGKETVLGEGVVRDLAGARASGEELGRVR